jgi:hypothetical protein
VHYCRNRRHADAQTGRSPSECRRRLLLESPGGLRVYGYPLHPSVARKYAPLRARDFVIWCWNDWTNGETAAEDANPAILTEVPMRLIGLVLALSLILVSSADAQQQGKVWRTGILSMAPASETPVFEAFRKALRELG